MAGHKGKQEPELVRRDGGLCVTFVNSASAKRRSFQTYAELLAWGHSHGAVTSAEVERLERLAAERPADAEAVAGRALELRDCCERTLRGLIRRRGPSEADVERLHAELLAVRSAERWVRSGLGCRWVLGDRGGDDLDRMLWPVATSMAEVLSTKYCHKVRECAGEGCNLLFVDRAPGSPRKWCSMKACGNKVKSRRDYHRRVKPERERARKIAAEFHRKRIEELQREAREKLAR